MQILKSFHNPFYFQAIWKLLYCTKSAGDIGTLYQARNYLNARGVKTDPMKAVNDSQELIEKYSEALLLSATDQLKKDDPGFYEQMVATKGMSMFNEFVDKLVQKFIVVEREIVPSESPVDSILNYSKNALTLGYLAKDLTLSRLRKLKKSVFFVLFARSTSNAIISALTQAK